MGLLRKKSRIDMAREAYLKKDMQLHKHAHDSMQIGNEYWHKTSQGKYLGSAVYGATDGIVTTFAVVAGAAGAKLSIPVILIMGFANLFADGFSMAIGDFLSEKSERDYIKDERKREEWEVEVNPQGEKMELEEIYKQKGLSEDKVKKLVEIISSDKKIWVDTMMKEELGLMEDDDVSPLKSAMVTFIAFVTAGFMPLVAYLIGAFVPIIQQNQFVSACLITGITLFFVGSLRQIVTGVRWYISGLEMLLVGGLSASVAYFVGFLLSLMGIKG